MRIQASNIRFTVKYQNLNTGFRSDQYTHRYLDYTNYLYVRKRWKTITFLSLREICKSVGDELWHADYPYKAVEWRSQNPLLGSKEFAAWMHQYRLWHWGRKFKTYERSFTNIHQRRERKWMDEGRWM